MAASCRSFSNSRLDPFHWTRALVAGIHRAAPIIAFTLMARSPAIAVTNVVNQSLKDWRAAAISGRADILILGDSTVQSNSWCNAIEQGAVTNFGLAGSGVMEAGVPNGSDSGLNTNTNNYTGRFSYDYKLIRPSSGWSVLDADIPSTRLTYQPDYGQSNSAGRSAFSATAKTTALGGLGMRLGQGSSPTPGTALIPNGAYDYTVWTASPAGGGSMGAVRKDSSGVAIDTKANVTTTTPAVGLQKTVFSFPANSSSGYQDITVNNVTNTTVMYSRVSKAGASPQGVTVSGWSISGGATYHMRQRWDAVNYSSTALSSDGGQAYLSAITNGGSGKLNVMLFFGLNESHETNAPTSNSARYKSDMQSLISAVSADWTAAGKAASDLSFTIFGMYDANNSAYSNAAMRVYAQQAHDVAAANTVVSFIDLQPMQLGDPSLYLQSDGVHLSTAGASDFGPKIFAAIPEPASMSMLILGAGLVGRRRVRRCRSLQGS